MTEYEQLEHLFLSLGVSSYQDTSDDDTDVPSGAQCSISVGLTSFWFDAAGQFLGVDHTDFRDGWEPRRGTLSAPTGSREERLITALQEAAGVRRFPLSPEQKAEARVNIQSLGYPTWVKADFIPPPLAGSL